jgi:hypothetical protein
MGTGAVSYSQSNLIAAQSAQGSLSGRLTDLHSKPLEGVTLVLRDQATGNEVARTISAKGGAYSFAGLKPGVYELEALSSQLGRGQAEEIVVSAGHEARVQLAIELQPLTSSPVLSAKLNNLEHPAVEPETSPGDFAELPSEPLLQLPLRGRWIRSELLETTASAFQAELAEAPLQTIPLIGRSLPPTMAALAAAATESKILIAQSSGPVSPAVTTTVSATELQALPVSGRHWQDFVLDNAPTSATPAGGQGSISLGGEGRQTAEIAVDGMGRGLAFGSTNGQRSEGRGEPGQGSEPAGMAQIGVGGHGLAISEAAIREVQTAAGSVEAAANRAAGGRMDVETQSGSNELHGQGFFFDRQNSWGARNPFTQWVTETGSTQPFAPYNSAQFPVFDNGPGGSPESYTPPDHETTWGVGVGSRIRRDKLFWFAAFDNYERNDAGVAMVKHPYLSQPEPSTSCANPPCYETTGFFAQPTNDQMQVLSAQLGLPSANPIVEGLTAYSTMLETLGGLLGPAPRTATQWTGFARIDWQASERNRVTVEGIGADWNSPGGGVTRVSESYGNHSFGSTKASEEWLLGRWEAFLTPNLLAVTQASFAHAVQQALPTNPSDFEKTLLAGNAWGQLPQIVVDNRYGFTIGNPSRFGQGKYPDEHLYHAQESLDWIHGKLLVKAGFSADHNADETSLLRNQTGTYTYSSVVNFATDALVFAAFGPSDALDPKNPHNCDETGKVWRDSGGGLRGLGNLPCYTSYSQTMGPPDWRLSTNDWAGYATAQWEANKLLVFSGGLRWEREQLPPAMAALNNPNLPQTQKLPNLGNNWGPRVSLAVGDGKKHSPVMRLGYGLYFARTPNLTVETALTQTGSLQGDLNFFMRPTDDLPNYGGGAPPFPYVLQGEPSSVIKPGAVQFAPVFHNPEIHQAVAAVEETLPAHIEVTASAMASLGRRLPIAIDTNLNPPTTTQTITYAVIDPLGAGPIKAPQITVPFYASWPGSAGSCPYYKPTSGALAGRPCPDYQQITEIESRANSTYEAAMLKIERYSRRGLSLHAHYTYSHAMDWNPNESAQIAGNDVLDPANFGLEYGVSNLDIRHSAGVMAIYEAPWKLHGMAGKLGNNWMLSGVGQFHSGLPYTMHTSGSLAEEFTQTGAAIVGLGPGMNGAGGDNRVYGVGSDKTVYNIGRNSYRYPATWKADLRLGRRFDFKNSRQLELLIESFNLFNHQNVTEVETTGYTIEHGTATSLPTLNFLTGPLTQASGTILHPSSTAFGAPLNVNATNFYRERQIQIGARMRF